ncbi:MAG: respiratory nitrate reductase subunit gamma [Gammaproteobacteria bacterium]|nr:respiratory nitrate reductase subunit gamma [Gammaproteobacteria bacterium]
MMSVLYALLFYVATALFIGGLFVKIRQYARTPAPLKIPTTPAPTTQSGVAYRIFREVALFESLFKSNKWIWILGYLFHVGLALVLLRHFRYFTDPVWWWVELVQPFGVYAGFAMVLGLLGLLGRRIVVERIRYISGPSDYLMLILIIMIGVSGLMMKFVNHTDIVMVKQFMLGLMVFDIRELPTDGPLLIHLALVAVLMIIFPISKLLHAPGVFFSPTRNQVDNPRERRHIAPWANELDK